MANPLSIRPTKVSATQANNPMQTADFLNTETIKKFSMVFLGHGYDRITKSANKMLELVVEEFTEENVEIQNYECSLKTDDPPTKKVDTGNTKNKKRCKRDFRFSVYFFFGNFFQKFRM